MSAAPRSLKAILITTIHALALSLSARARWALHLSKPAARARTRAWALGPSVRRIGRVVFGLCVCLGSLVCGGAGESGSRPVAAGPRVSIRANGLGNPLINFREGFDLPPIFTSATGSAGVSDLGSVASWTLACFDSVMLSDCVFNEIQFDQLMVSTNRMATLVSPDGHASQTLLSNASATYGRLGADSELVARGNNIVGHFSYLLSYAFMDDTLIVSAPGQSGGGVGYVDFHYQGAGGGSRGSPRQGGPYASPTLWFYSGPAPQQDWTLFERDAYAPLVEGIVTGTAIPFTFDSPFGFHAAILAQVELHCNPSPDAGELPCESWTGTGFANFSNVATISSIRVFNSAGDPVTDFSITAQSGTDYAPATPRR